ncbi:hypothetical protein BGW38_004049 [Lunasporangiospora selenospora]|uniref:NADP-dependent oxidoreductase domain-containing protein n=1 Tax=Lunasporangiospora selenospora TaxID=979761 RepID=A0A9P6FQ82_9FUNG|nr:hypothetical protein BGW38_004049 [Lunasporangiospora selenospora]
MKAFGDINRLSVIGLVQVDFTSVQVRINEVFIRVLITVRLGLAIEKGGLKTRIGLPAEEAVLSALHAGYRHIDTAAAYGNEVSVGNAIRNSGIPRDQIFVTTKLRDADHGYESALAACELSLEKLGLDYVDLYLIHSPIPGPERRTESWRALQKLVHPWLSRPEIISFCESQHIAVEAYSPLSRGRRLEDPVLAKIANKYSKSPAQVLIRWSLQKGYVVLPKSSDKERIEQNADVFDFDLADGDMAVLDSLNEEFYSGMRHINLVLEML